ncbi:MAG: DUF1501 domain-containing protein [Myxococcaceae bacterium]|nr:DUF1501 domain-containing protein [Myxococcaceae bacterium]
MQASLGATQLALLSKFGVMPGAARAASSGFAPTRLLTINMGGGWHAPHAFFPRQALPAVPAPTTHDGEPVYFDSGALQNLDGSGTSMNGGYEKLVIPKLWNQSALDAGQKDPRNGTSPHGYAWQKHQLWTHASVVHGVDQMTAAHAAGPISALCGVASSEWRSPAIHAWVASALYSRFANSRALPVVHISGPDPASLSLRGEVAAMAIREVGDVATLLSDRSDQAWLDLRARTEKDQLNFDGSSNGRYATTPVEDRILQRLRKRRGLVNSGTASYLETLHRSYEGVSKVLARDLVDIVERTKGSEYTPVASWADGGGRYSTTAGSTHDDALLQNGLELALRLFKADLVTAISIGTFGPFNYSFDLGHSQGHLPQFAMVRATMDVVGRFLGEMKATPTSGGRNLLDETIVMLVSDFSRTWPKSGTCDHATFTSVPVIGGGIAPNRMMGGFDMSDVTAINPAGLPVDIVENGVAVQRAPRSGDVLHSVMSVMGVTGFRIPGGSGEITGLTRG